MFEPFIEALPDAILLVDSQGVVRGCNQVATELFRATRAELVGHSISRLMPQAEEGRHGEHVRAFTTSPRRRAMGEARHLRARRLDGTEFPVEISLNPFHWQGQDLVVAALRDVTAQRAVTEALQVREAHLKHIMEVAKVAQVTFNCRSRAITAGGEFFTHLGLDAAAIASDVRARILPEDLARLAALERKAMVDRRPFAALVRLRDVAGAVHWLDCRCVPHGDDAGQPLEIHTLVMDVTELRKTEESERQARDQLLVSERLASIGLLAAGVAHEINNPLMAVLTNLALAQELVAPDAPSGDDGVAQMLTEAHDAAARVRDIVRDLKVFSRHEPQAPVAFDVQAVVESSLRLVRNEVRHTAQVVTRFEATAPVLGSPSRLGQVVLNLVMNALQAMEARPLATNQLTLALGSGPDGHVVLEVTDTGTGIAPEHLARLFTQFFTTKPAGKGTGLGLAISRRIVESMGGTLTAQSEVGRGTTFRAVFPPADQAATSTPTPRAGPRGATSLAPPGARARVLVIDDDAVVGAAMRRALESRYDVVLVQRAVEAIERLRAGEGFAAIVCDVMMPEVGGAEMLEAARQYAPALVPRIIFVTGGAFSVRARAFIETLGGPLLEKPVAPGVLLDTVAAVVAAPA